MNRPVAARGDEFALTFATVGIGLVLGLGTLLWTAGQLSALLVHQVWPDVPISAGPGILVRLATSLGRPARAWPVHARTQLPGAGAIYAVLLVLLLALGAAAVAGFRCIARIQQRSRRAERDRSEVWARPEQVRHLLLARPAPNRVVLGRLNGRTVASEARRSVLVVAPTQAGKTSRFVVPTIARWEGPLVVTSVKSDVLMQTVARRRIVSDDQVCVFDPTGVVDPTRGIEIAHWSPLLLSTTYPEAERAARWLIKAAQEDRPDVNGKFWENTAAKLLAPLLFAAANTAGDLGTLSYWIDTKEVAEVEQILRELRDADALNAWAATCGRESKTRDSAYATAESLAGAFTSPSVRAATTIDDATLLIDAQQALDQRQTVYLVAPVHEQELYAPLFVALIQSIVRAAQTRYARSGEMLDPPLMLMLDEAAHVAPLPDLPILAATGAGQGIQVCSVWQDLAQIENRYAKRARSVITNHTARVFLRGSGDEVMLEHLSRMIGDHPVVRETRSVDETGRRTRSRSRHDSRLAPLSYLRTLPEGTAIVLNGADPPMRLTTTPWFDDPVIRAQLRQPPAPPMPRHPQDEPPPVAPRPNDPPTGRTSPSTLEAPMLDHPSTPGGWPTTPDGPTHSTLQGLVPDPDHAGYAVNEAGRRYLISPAADGTPIPIPLELTDEERAELDAARDRVAAYAAELHQSDDEESSARVLPFRLGFPSVGDP